MTSNANPRSETPLVKAASPVTKGATQAPAVPISLYREVANELQTAKTDLHSMRAENQHLIQQNQQLRLEIERVVQSTLHLRQLADSYRSGQGTLDTFSSHLETLDFHTPAIAPAQDRFDPTPAKPSAPAPEATNLLSVSSASNSLANDSPVKHPTKVLTGQESQPHAIAAAESSSEISTWWLVVVVCLIVVSAFGTGFLIVRPFLPSR